MYNKPHLSYMKQLDTLVSRGMEISNRDVHVGELKRIGYYRLSAYSYPFRILLPKEKRESPTNYRSEEFLSGTSFDTVVQLANFDSELRRLIFEAIEQIEVVLCTRVAYRAGQVDPFIHLNKKSLDLQRCDSKIPGRKKQNTRWEAWQTKFEKLYRQAGSEDFCKHFKEKYEGHMPIWVAIEFIDFGGLTRFFYLLPSKTQSQIAKEFGVSSGVTFSKWIVGLNYLRNKVAHHNRLWNRTMTYGLQAPKLNEVNDDLVHLQYEKNNLTSTYAYLAVIAYLMKQIRPSIGWHHKVVELMDQFPTSDYVSPEKDMKFPQNWRSLTLWN